MAVSEQEVKLKVKGMLGVSSPFYQGGSIRLTIPKRVAAKFDMEQKIGKEFYSMIFLDTDKGMLLLPLEKVVRPDNIRDALKFFDISNLSDEDLEILFKEE